MLAKISFFDSFFSKSQYRFQKRLKYSTLPFDNARKNKKCVDKGKVFGVLLTAYGLSVLREVND